MAIPGRVVASERRRREILDAALVLFLDRGVSRTTIDEIRNRSGASIGSLYHHFRGGKEQIAAALYVESLRDYQEGFLRELSRHTDAEAGIKAIVRYHLRWIQRNPDRARFLFHHREPEVALTTEKELREMNRRFLSEAAAWVMPRIDAAGSGVLPADLVSAIWLGPAQEFARHWLAGRASSSLGRAGRVLADAAWAALRPTGERK